MPALGLMPVLWFFIFSFVACATVYFALDRRSRPLQKRLNELAVRFRSGDDATLDQPGAHGLSAALMEWAQRRMPDPDLDKPAVEKLVQTLQHAGFDSPGAPKIFQAIRLGLAISGAALGYFLCLLSGGQAPLIYIAAGIFVGYLLPLFYVRRVARSRQSKIRRELADVIDLLVVCVECGLGLLAAIRVVGRESERQDRLMGAQLARLSAELVAGSSLGEGLRAVAQRTGVDDVRTLAAILVQSEKLGTEMAQALHATSDQLRTRRTLRAEEMAQKLPVKMMIPLILFLLPAMMLILAGPPAIEIFRTFRF